MERPKALNLFDARGRMGRLPFAAFLAVSLPFSAFATVPGFPPLARLAAVLIAIFLTAAPAIRRLHDMNLSGFIYLAVFVPILNVGVLAVLLLLPGTRGINRFG